MEPNQPTDPPSGLKPVNWPILVNLGLLVLIVGPTGGDPLMLLWAVGGLAVVNGLAALVVRLFGPVKWMHAFILSALIVLLIGLGICGFLLSKWSGPAAPHGTGL